MAQKVAILTNFMDFNPGYSLSGIVVDQALMLAKYGHEVHLFVNEQFNPQYNDDSGLARIMDAYSDYVFVHKKTKFMHLTDYQAASAMTDEHRNAADEAAETYATIIKEYEIGTIFTHDFIFTGWSVPYALACKLCTKKLAKMEYAARWFHWVHSVPSGTRDWWEISAYGNMHKLVFPNRTEINRVAESFKTDPSSVVVIPHIKDMRTYYDFSDPTMEFLEKYEHIMDMDVIQVYPVSTDRMSAKQLDLVIRLFGEIKKMKFGVCLIAANQWATGRQRKESVEKYISLAEENGLEYGTDFIFTSEVSFNDEMVEELKATNNHIELGTVLGETVTKEQFEDRKVKEIESYQLYPKGISKRMLRELQLLSNLFVFPTKEESFGLVGPEAAFSGALPVTNRSLFMMAEVMSNHPPMFDFGSFHNAVDRIDDESYVKAVAMAIMNRVLNNEAVSTKTYCRKKYNMDSLYHRFYLPMCL